MKTLKTLAVVNNLNTVIGFVDEYLESLNCSGKNQMMIDLSVEEIFVNIASYAYPDTTGDVEIRLHETDRVISITFIDSGIPYDPLKKKDPDITLSAELRQIGGLGIYLVKKNMDHVNYSYDDGQNVLTISKKI